MLLLLTLSACNSEIQIGYETASCEDWDFSEDSEPAFEVATTDTEIQIARVGVFHGCEDAFEPTVSGEDGSIVINEYWVSEGGDCEACFAPTIRIYDPPPQMYEIYWFDESSNVTPIWSTELNLEE